MISIGTEEIAWEEGMTVSTVLSKLKDGHIYAVVKINDKLVSQPYFNTTLVPDGAKVTPIPMIAGG
jgi:sulfur carrier protein ThiS